MATRTTRPPRVRKAATGAPGDPVVVLAHGKRRADQSYALAIGVGGALLLVGLAALAAWLHYLRGIDLSVIARTVVAPGGLGVGVLGLLGWVLRERLAPQQAGMQREVAAVKVELEKARAARDAEQAVDRAEITELKATVGRLIGVTDQLVTSQSKTSDAVIGQRRGIDEATSAALGATAAVVELQRVLLEAAQAGAKRREEAERVPAPAPQPPAPSPAEVEEERSAKVRAAGQRLREAREDAERRAAQAAAEAAAAHQASLEQEAASAQAAGASWLDTGDVTTTPAQPLTALPASTPVARTVHYPDRIITPLDPEWVPPRTGTMPVVPPKTDPNVSTAVHQWFHTGRWPYGFSPDDPPPAPEQ